MLQVIKKWYNENLIIFNFLKRILKFITLGNSFFNFFLINSLLVWFGVLFVVVVVFYDNLHALF